MGQSNCCNNENQMLSYKTVSRERLFPRYAFFTADSQNLNQPIIDNPEEYYAIYSKKFTTKILSEAIEKYGNFNKFTYKIYDVPIENFLFVTEESDCFMFEDHNNRSFYYGQMIGNVKHGYGIFMSNSGLLMEGFFEDNYFQPFGRIINSEGELLEGSFRCGELNGKGKIVRKESTYLGLFVNGYKHGYGEETADKWTYKGQFCNNLRHGHGELTKRNGEKYIGSFASGLYEGYGKISLKNGEYYAGQFLKGKYHGFGEYCYSDGNIYKGIFEEGIRKGKGELTYSNNNVFKGIFNGDPIEGLIKYPNDESKHVKFIGGSFLEEN